MFSSILTPENKALLLSNLKSLLWRFALLGAAMGVDFLSQNLNLLTLPTWEAVAIGTLLGEVHDFLNQKYGIDAGAVRVFKSVLPKRR